MNLNFLKKIALLSTVMLSGICFSCSDSDENLQTELSQEEVKEIISVNNFVQDMLVFSKKFNDVKPNTRGTDDGNSPCRLIKFLKIEDGKFKYNFDSGCEFWGRTFAGALEIEYKPNGWGYTRTVTYKNFISDGINISGKSVYNATLRNKAGHFLVGISSDLTVKFKNGKTISRNGTIQLEKIEGNKTLRLSDDIYATSGSWNSVGFDGVNRSVTITKDLKTKSLTQCLYATEGKIIIKKADKEYFIDFGNGECDHKINFNGKEIVL